MEVEQTLKNWFDGTCDLMEGHFQEHRQETQLENTVNASVSVVQNYLWSILKLLDRNQADQHILPAKALLRCLYQLTSRMTWILMGASADERKDRIEQLEKKSLEDESKLAGRILEVYKNDARENTRIALQRHEKARRDFSKRIENLNTCGTERLPSPIEILKEVFGGEYGEPREGPGASELVPIRGWPDLHKAVHPDYIALNSTISNSENAQSYDGDTREDVAGIKYECCACVHRFLKEIYKFYGFVNFDTIDNDFRELGNAIVSR